MKPARLLLLVASVGAAAALSMVVTSGSAAGSTPIHLAINCANASAMCTEVANSDEVFGHYVGHDEPSVLFYSNTPGSGNNVRYNLTLPTDPPAANPLAP